MGRVQLDRGPCCQPQAGGGKRLTRLCSAPGPGHGRLWARLRGSLPPGPTLRPPERPVLTGIRRRGFSDKQLQTDRMPVPWEGGGKDYASGHEGKHAMGKSINMWGKEAATTRTTTQSQMPLPRACQRGTAERRSRAGRVTAALQPLCGHGECHDPPRVSAIAP